MKYEWDAEKNSINQRKHGISFEVAVAVFWDDYRLELYDEMHSVEEDRYIAIGLVEEVLFVVYTERKDRVRLISARLANEHERRLYFDRKLYPT